MSTDVENTTFYLSLFYCTELESILTKVKLTLIQNKEKETKACWSISSAPILNWSMINWSCYPKIQILRVAVQSKRLKTWLILIISQKILTLIVFFTSAVCSWSRPSQKLLRYTKISSRHSRLGLADNVQGRYQVWYMSQGFRPCKGVVRRNTSRNHGRCNDKPWVLPWVCENDRR